MKKKVMTNEMQKALCSFLAESYRKAHSESTKRGVAAAKARKQKAITYARVSDKNQIKNI